ncbi:MAG TPA: hypothetical protein VGN12_27360 [Pirellulales bacterium]|jgi:hypothetical protein
MATAFASVPSSNSIDTDQANEILEHIEDGLRFSLGRKLSAEFEGIKDRLDWRFEGDRLHVAFVINGTMDIPRSPEGAFESLYKLIQGQANLIRYHLRLGDTLRPIEPGVDVDFEDLEVEPAGTEPSNADNSSDPVLRVNGDVFRPDGASS